MVAALGLLSTGCLTVYGPAERKMKAADACTPALARYDCAPVHGSPRMALDRFPKNLTIDASGNPNVLDYLGTTVGVNVSTGRPGDNCGRQGVTPFTTRAWALDGQDDSGGDIERRVTQTYTLRRTSGAEVKGSIVTALELAGVPAAVLEQLDGDVNLTINRLESAHVAATGVFRQYQLRPDLLRAMKDGIFTDELVESLVMPLAGNTPPDQRATVLAARVAEQRRLLIACHSEVMASPATVRMYQALTGFHVLSYEADTSTVDTITGLLAARVKALDPTQDVATLKASLNSVATTAIRTSMKPTFVVSGVSFWNPTDGT